MTNANANTKGETMKEITVTYRPGKVGERQVALTVPGSLEGAELKRYITVVLGSDFRLQ